MNLQMLKKKKKAPLT